MGVLLNWIAGGFKRPNSSCYKALRLDSWTSPGDLTQKVTEHTVLKKPSGLQSMRPNSGCHWAHHSRGDTGHAILVKPQRPLDPTQELTRLYPEAFNLTRLKGIRGETFSLLQENESKRRQKSDWIEQIAAIWRYRSRILHVFYAGKPQKWVWMRFIEDANADKLSHWQKSVLCNVPRERLWVFFAADVDKFHASLPGGAFACVTKGKECGMIWITSGSERRESTTSCTA